MAKITRASLLTSKTYAAQRAEWRDLLIPFKKLRTVHIGNNATLQFENELTVRYHLQEMMRVDKSMEKDELIDELAIYNELLPTADTLTATLMFEFVDPNIRAVKLAQLPGVEHSVWIEIDERGKIYSTPCKNSQIAHTNRAESVHFLNFKLDEDSLKSLLLGDAVSLGIDHPAYEHSVSEISPETQVVIMEDLKAFHIGKKPK